MRQMQHILMACWLVNVGCAVSALAQADINNFMKTAPPADQKEVVAPLAAIPPKMDGALDAPAWIQADKLGGFYRIKENRQAAEQTVVTVTHTTNALYFMFVVADPTIVAKERKRDDGTWNDDCVEIFLDPQRERKDRFHFIISASGMVYDAKLDDAKWNADPELTVNVKTYLGQGWIAQVAIPFKTLGVLAPAQGDVWDLKLAREDYSSANGTSICSTWQSGANFADTGSFGKLVFINRNRSINGDFSHGLNGWRQTSGKQDALTVVTNGGRNGRSCGKVIAGAYVQICHSVPVKPYRNYRISAWVNMDEMQGARNIEFYTDPNTNVKAASLKGWQKLETCDTVGARTTVGIIFTSYYATGGSFLVGDVAVEEIDNVPRPADSICYTGNAVGEQTNCNRQVAGRYTYCELGSKAPFFPQSYGGSPGYNGSPDVLEFTGWIPFSTGKLTDGKPTYVNYHWNSQTPGKTILMDLGADRFITDIEIEPVNVGLRNFAVRLKPDKAPHYTLAAKPVSPGGSIQATDINAHARFVWIDFTGDTGIREIRIWGKDKPGSMAPKPYALTGKNEPGFGTGGPALVEKGFAVFPTPKQAKEKKNNFRIKDSLKVAVPADASEITLRTADELIKQLTLMTGVHIEREQDNRIAGDGFSFSNLIGQLKEWAKNEKSAGIRLSVKQVSNGTKAKGDEGYVLNVFGNGIEIIGGGERGLLYGCQTLLQCLVNAPGGFAVRGVEIRDWPSYPMRMLEAWPLQLADEGTLRAVETLARMKMNYMVLMDNEAANVAYSQRLAQLGMETVIRCASMSGNASWPQLEMNPGETRKSLPSLERVNPCPSDPQNRAYIDQEVAKAARFPGKYASISCDEMYQELKGARWNVCPLCTARNMSGGELFRELIQTIYDKLAKVGKKPMMLDTMYWIPYKGMNEAFKKLPKDIPIIIWHGGAQKGLTELGFPVGEFLIHDKWGTIDMKAANVFGGYIPADGGFKIQKGIVFAEALWSGKYPDMNDPVVIRRISDIMVQVHQAIIDAPLPSLMAAPDAFTPLDISTAANVSLTDEKAGDGKGLLDVGPGMNLSFMKGIFKLAGVPFRIGGKDDKDIVVLENRGALDPRYADEIRVPIGRKAASLLFLHALTTPMAWSYSMQLTYAGTYLVEYADGSRVAYPIEYKNNILEYDALAPEANEGIYKSNLIVLPGAVPAYKGVTPSGKPILLLAAEWVNPFPAKEISAVIMRSTSRMFGTRVALFGLTAIAPTPQGEEFWSGRKTPTLPPEPSHNIPSELKEQDLSGGTFVSNSEYLAPDSTRLVASTAYVLENVCFVAFMKVGYVTVDGNLGWQVYRGGPQTLIITFPAERAVGGISLLGLPQTPEYIFGNVSPIDYMVETTLDEKTWEKVAERKGYLADRDWESVHTWPVRSVKAIRITLAPSGPKACAVRGLARVKILVPDIK